MNTQASIPKMIHYCWFGRGKMLPLAIKCMDSWKKQMPDYQLMEWNEDNFDINSNLYVKQAYENKKYAFVTDYVRLYALYQYGGIYMDTDVEVFQPLDRFLCHEAFSSFESAEHVPTGMMAAKKGHPFMKELLDDYDNRIFVKPDGSFDMTTNTEVITNACLQYGLVQNDKLQTVNGMTFYPTKYFKGFTFFTLNRIFNFRRYTVHYYAGSWGNASDQTKVYKFFMKLRHCIFQRIIKTIGYEKYKKLRDSFKKLMH